MSVPWGGYESGLPTAVPKVPHGSPPWTNNLLKSISVLTPAVSTRCPPHGHRGLVESAPLCPFLTRSLSTPTLSIGPAAARAHTHQCAAFPKARSRHHVTASSGVHYIHVPATLSRLSDPLSTLHQPSEVDYLSISGGVPPERGRQMTPSSVPVYLGSLIW